MNPYGPAKEFPILLKHNDPSQDCSMDDTTHLPGSSSGLAINSTHPDLEVPIGFIATLYNQMFKEVCNRPTGQRQYMPLSMSALPSSLPAYYVPPTARMNDKIKEMDANIARLKEMIKDDRRLTNSAGIKLPQVDSGVYSLRSSELQSGERKRRRTGSDEEESNVPQNVLRSQFRRRADSSSSEDEKEAGGGHFGRSRSRSTSPVNKRRHFAFTGSSSSNMGGVSSTSSEGPRGSGGAGFSSSALGLGAHPGLGSMAAESGDVFDNYRRQRSTRYHKAIAAAFQAKMGPGSDDKLCYICHQPGHFAKHCKFGIS